jgi:DNA-binding MarR family transcriptional regulator
MSETRRLDEREREAWVKFAAVLELLPGVLDGQLGRDAGLNHFEYLVLVMLSDAEQRTLRMTALARRTNATLPRLSRVVSRLEAQGLVMRAACPEDGRATNVTLTEPGESRLRDAAPGHIATLRSAVFDGLEPAQVDQLSVIASKLLMQLDPDGKLAASSVAD